MKLWIVGQVKNYPFWEFQGVFDSEERAIAACKASNWFFAPAELNEELSEKSSLWHCLKYHNNSIPLISNDEIEDAAQRLKEFSLDKNFLFNILEKVFELTARSPAVTSNTLKTLLTKLNQIDFCNICSIDINCSNEHKLLRLAQVVNNSSIIKDRVLDICGVYQVNTLKAIFKSLQ